MKLLGDYSFLIWHILVWETQDLQDYNNKLNLIIPNAKSLCNFIGVTMQQLNTPKNPFCCCCLVSKLCLTLCDPMNCSPPGFSVHGIFQGRILEWVVFSSFSWGSSWPRNQTHVFFLYWQADSLSLSYQGSLKNPYVVRKLWKTLKFSFIYWTPVTQRRVSDLIACEIIDVQIKVRKLGPSFSQERISKLL